jgi:hypothetical protein
MQRSSLFSKEELVQGRKLLKTIKLEFKPTYLPAQVKDDKIFQSNFRSPNK